MGWISSFCEPRDTKAADPRDATVINNAPHGSRKVIRGAIEHGAAICSHRGISDRHVPVHMPTLRWAPLRPERR